MYKNIIVVVISVLLVVGSIFLIKRSQKNTADMQSNAVIENPAVDVSGMARPGEVDEQVTVPVISQISLTVVSPAGGSTVTTSKVSVKGKTLPKAEIFANEAEGIADASGNFSLSVNLDEGENSIIVTAVDQDGNVAEKEILVTYDSGE